MVSLWPPCSRDWGKCCLNFFKKRAWRSLLLGQHPHSALGCYMMGWSQPWVYFHVWVWICVEVIPLSGDWQVDALFVNPAPVSSHLVSLSFLSSMKRLPKLGMKLLLGDASMVSYTAFSASWRVWPMNCHSSAVSCIIPPPLPKEEEHRQQFKISLVPWDSQQLATRSFCKQYQLRAGSSSSQGPHCWQWLGSHSSLGIFCNSQRRA